MERTAPVMGAVCLYEEAAMRIHDLDSLRKAVRDGQKENAELRKRLDGQESP